MPHPTLTVIVPFFNAPQNLVRCLEGLRTSTIEFELLLADDASTDASARDLAEGAGRVIRLEKNGGPGAARNAAAQVAQGDVLVFIDSDVVVQPTTLERIAAAFEADPELGSLFGSYDDDPAHPSWVSTYRNLLHHHTHQVAPKEASTFWAGCGAIRRDLFLSLGGYDVALFTRPSIEDIELGMRMRAAGERIEVHPDIQCKHLKHWRFIEMIRVDVFQRAIPWGHLLLERAEGEAVLNVSTDQKLSVVLAYLAPVIGVTLPWTLASGVGPPAAWIAAPVLCVLGILVLNRGFYGTLLRARGLPFAAFGAALHYLYFLYCGFAHVWVQVSHRVLGKRALTSGPPSVQRAE